jgi:hypothetical protein
VTPPPPQPQEIFWNFGLNFARIFAVLYKRTTVYCRGNFDIPTLLNSGMLEFSDVILKWKSKPFHCMYLSAETRIFC